ncbi:MAG: PDZ domain-containing protein [Alphaproteobacteria bacterium]
MIKSNLLVVLAVLLAMPFASRANMAPPLGYRLGIAVEKTQEGPRIVSVDKGSEAARSGLQIGDIILGVDGRYAKTFSDSDLKAFTDERHSWPMNLILARGDEVITLRVPS